MTIEEAKQKLADVESKEAAAWVELKALDDTRNALLNTWQPLYEQKKSMEMMIKIMQDMEATK